MAGWRFFQKNVCWKMSITKFKSALVLFKMRMGLTPTITKTDIVPLCNRAFTNSFTEVPSNLHDISDRGCNTLNQALLLNTEVLKKTIVKIVDVDTVPTAPRNIFASDQSVIALMTSTSIIASTSSATRSRDAQTINLASGSAGIIITDLLHYAMMEEGVNENLKNRYAEGKMLRGEIFEGKKRVTAGLLFKANQPGLDINVLNLQERKERIVFGTM